MTTNQFWTAVEKAKKVIDSCETREHLRGANSYRILLKNMASDSKLIRKETKNLVQIYLYEMLKDKEYELFKTPKRFSDFKDSSNG